MKFTSFSAITVAALAFALSAGRPLPAFAHAHLLTASPSTGEVVVAPSTLKFVFSEGIEIDLSKIDVLDAKGQAVEDASAGFEAGNNKIVLVQLKTPLAPGVYTVRWHVVAVDTHKTDGTYTFTVKP